MSVFRKAWIELRRQVETQTSWGKEQLKTLMAEVLESQVAKDEEEREE